MVLSTMISGLKNSQTVGQWDSKMGQFLILPAWCDCCFHALSIVARREIALAARRTLSTQRLRLFHLLDRGSFVCVFTIVDIAQGFNGPISPIQQILLFLASLACRRVPG
jgi:hypothetical protein